MARYFFDVSDGDTVLDPTGEILEDNGQAQAVAVRILAELIPGRGGDIWGGRALRILILDAHRRPIGELRVTAISALS